MTQVDLNNPTLEFLDVDPAIAAQYGKSDSISYLMNSLADFLNIPESVVTLPLLSLIHI